ncbi:MAG: fasciclin domain-containing protein [Draconibacterium sp.]
MKNGKLLFLLLLVLCFSGCEKEFTKYYEYDGSTETIYEILQKKGNYTLFTEALDIVGYGNILSEAGLFTVLAVNDESFQAYLNDNGYSEVKDIQVEELKDLIGYHIIDWPYVASKLSSGYSSPDTPEDPLMIRKLTRCSPDVFTETDPETEKQLLVVSENKLMPFFSKEYEEEMELTSGDLQGFFPDLSFNLESGDVIASNGKLVEKDISAINGWIHVVDRVLTPLRNHREILEQEDNYSLFRDLAKRFATYDFNSGYTDEYQIDLNSNGDNDSLYVMNWFKLNREYTGISAVNVSGNAAKIAVQKNFVSAFIPTNQALTEFFANYYPGISPDEISTAIAPPALEKIVQSCVFEGKAWFPSAVSAGKLKTPAGLPYIYDETDFQKEEMASNGLFYGVNHFRAPDEYNALTKLFVTDTTYSYFLVALDLTNYLDMLVSDNVNFTVFALKNETFRNAGYFLNEDQNGFVDADGNNASLSMLYSSFKNSIILGELDVSSFTNDMFYKTISPKESYLRISPTEVTANGTDIATIVNDGYKDANGVVYEVDNFLISPDATTTIGYYLKNTTRFSTFYTLCREAGIIDDESGTTVLFNEGNMSCFAPTNDALASAVIPEDPDELKEFLAKFFVKKVIYSDGQNEGTFDTFAKDLSNTTSTGLANVKVDISAAGGVITVTNKGTGDSALTTADNNSNIMLYNGCLHTIESVY